MTGRIVLYCHTSRPGGAELAAPVLASTIGAEIWSRGEGPTTRHAVKIGVPLRILRKVPDRRPSSLRERFNAVLSVVTAQAEVSRLLRRRTHSKLISNTLQGVLHLGIPARLRRVPLIVYVRDLGYGGNRPVLEVVVYRFLLAVCARGVIFNSQTTRDSWRLRLPSIVVPTAVDERYFAAPSRDRDGGVIMVGRIARWKGQAQVISAMNALADSGFTTSLTLVGDKTFEDDVALPEARFPVHFTGFSDPLDHLSNGGLLVHASTTPEPFGQVLAQAAAAGIPIVCADRGGQTEWLTHNASCLMANPTRVDELASAIVQTLSDGLGAEKRAAEARSKAQMFRPEVAYEPIGHWLEEICGR